MDVKYAITIPKPCHENWNAMVPDPSGRFCTVCSKSVVDFTQMESTEIQGYFIQNQGQKICGRFKTEQLDSIIIQIPSTVLYSQVHFRKIFMLALLIAMGTSLFSCQNSKGVKQKIDGVQVVDSVEKPVTLGMMLPPKGSLKMNTVQPKFKSHTLPFTDSTSELTGFTVTKLAVDSINKDEEIGVKSFKGASTFKEIDSTKTEKN